MSLLVAWLGNTDLRASEASAADGLGPILGALKGMPFSAVHVLSDHGPHKTGAYVQWLRGQFSDPVVPHLVELSSPTSFEEIYRAATEVVQEIKKSELSRDLTFHLSPGTPAMAAVWMLLAKTRYPASLIKSSREQGVKEVHIPFELSAEFVPSSVKGADEALTRLMQGIPPESPEFSAIVHRCGAMKRTVAMAHRLALRDVPVLVQGELGPVRNCSPVPFTRPARERAAPLLP